VNDKTALVIDNDESLVDLVSFVLGEKGFIVHTALDGDAGVAQALAHRPALIVCDLIMNQVHGFEVLQALRGRPELRDTTIIVTSMKSYKPDIDRARELGADEYLVKPFTTDELVAIVDRRLASPDAA
jgi:CheY-like chemotaxis protein